MKREKKSFLISPLHWFSVKASQILGHHSSSQHFPYTKSPPSVHHAQDGLPPVSPLTEVERILQHREAVTQKTPCCLKVSCSLPSVPREMLSDNSRRPRGRIRDAAYSVCLACLQTHPRRERYIYIFHRAADSSQPLWLLKSMSV